MLRCNRGLRVLYNSMYLRPAVRPKSCEYSDEKPRYMSFLFAEKRNVSYSRVAVMEVKN